MTAEDPAPVFTRADRSPQHPDERFGVSDHTTCVPPAVLVPYRDRDRSTSPRDPQRMAAVRTDIAAHGIGNPLALFHDGTRACLAEGGHRLAVALEQDLVEVPLRVIRLRSLGEVSNFAKDSEPISTELAPYLDPRTAPVWQPRP